MTKREAYYLTRWASRCQPLIRQYIMDNVRLDNHLVIRSGISFLFPNRLLRENHIEVSIKRWIQVQTKEEWQTFDLNAASEGYYSSRMIEAWLNRESP